MREMSKPEMVNRFKELVEARAQREGRAQMPTLDEISAETGISKIILSRWMNNRVSRYSSSILVRLMDYVDVDDVGEFLKRVDRAN